MPAGAMTWALVTCENGIQMNDGVITCMQGTATSPWPYVIALVLVGYFIYYLMNDKKRK